MHKYSNQLRHNTHAGENRLLLRKNRVHGGCNLLTGDAYSSYIPDPISGVSRGTCVLYSYIGIFHRNYEIEIFKKVFNFSLKVTRV